jgi:Na+/H+ antiporter NhaD/arsenite permease-like protein
MRPAGIVIFALTYLLISARRLSWLGFDGPAGALVGAAACVAFGVLSPKQALGAIDGATLLLLFGVMGMGAFLALDGFFDELEGRLVTMARTPTRLLGIIVWGSGVASAFITNDAVCVLGAPLVVRLIQKPSAAAREAHPPRDRIVGRCLCRRSESRRCPTRDWVGSFSPWHPLSRGT